MDRKKKKAKTRVPDKVDETFLGETVPTVLRQGMPSFHKIDKPTFERMCKEALAQLLGKPSALIGAGEGEGEEKEMSEKDQLLFTCVVTVLRAGFRERHKVLDLKRDLEAMNFPSFCVDGFLKIFKSKRKKVEKVARGESLRYPTLAQLKWRVDVTISTSSLSRVLKPSVIVQMALSDGSIKTFEMQVDQFHQLRYNVAKVLQYMRSLENRAIMSLVADLEVGKLKHA